MRRRSAPRALALASVLAAALLAPASSGATPTVVRTGGPSAPGDAKVAVVGSERNLSGASFRVLGSGGRVVKRGRLAGAPGSSAPWNHAYRADLSSVRAPGVYRVVVAGVTSRPWRVRSGGTSDLIPHLLRYLQTNRDGMEPALLHGPSHLNDAVIEDGVHDGAKVDLTGGWMDAGDMIHFTQTTSFSAALLEAAARVGPANRSALEAESDVGVRWLLKAHPFPDVFVTQVGGVVDHDIGFRDPATDDASPKKGIGTRFAYHWRGRAGSDTAGQVAAALAMASDREAQPARKAALLRAAAQWYTAGRATARATPALKGTGGFYVFRTWRGSMAAGAAALFRSTGNASYLTDALAYLASAGDERYAAIEPGTMGAFAAADICGSLGAAPLGDAGQRAAACNFLHDGATTTLDYTRQNAFSPASYFQWGTSGVNGALGAEAALAAGDAKFGRGRAIAAGARDYLLGRNPWGASFVAGYGPRSPRHLHTWASVFGSGLGVPDGAVVGGPAPLSEIKGQSFRPGGAFRAFNSAQAYEDRNVDYVTSEPAIDYATKAILLLALLQGELIQIGPAMRALDG